MNDKAIEYKSLIYKIELMIENIDKLGINTDKYKKTFNDILDEVENSTLKNKKSRDEYVSMFLIQDYSIGITKLKQLELVLMKYNVYFSALRCAEYISMQLNKNNSAEQIQLFANEMITAIKSISSSTLYYNDEKKVIEKVYNTVYQIIKLELITIGKSEIYNFCKNKEIDTYYFDICIKNEIEKLDLNKNENVKIKEKKLYLEKQGLSVSYFDLEFIKLLLCYDDQNNLRKNIIDSLDVLVNEINVNVSDFNDLKIKYNWNMIGFKTIKEKYNGVKKDLLLKMASLGLTISIIFGGVIGINKFSKKINTNEHYVKEITRLSKYGLETEEGYAEIDAKDKIYIKEYGVWEKERSIYERKVEKYDVSHLNLNELENYLDIDINELGINPDIYNERISISQLEVNYKEGYREVEQEKINRNKKVLVTNDIYILTDSIFYIIFISLIILLEDVLNKKTTNFGLINNINRIKELLKGFYICEYEQESIFELRSNYLEKLKVRNETLKELLEYINKDEMLREKFNKLYEENKFLLENPEELYKKINKLKDVQDIKDEKINIKKLKK